MAGLTAVKATTYMDGKRAALGWALRNGFWHAFLLLTYGVFAVLLIDFAFLQGLEALLRYLPRIAAPRWLVNIFTELRGHFTIMFALVTIGVVWKIYRGKIVENPLDGAGDHPASDEALDWQRRLIRWGLVTFGAPARWIGLQLQSVAVAIDMLALALLLRALDAFDGSVLRVAEISAIIFLSVSAIVFVTSRFLHRQFTALFNPSGDAARRRQLMRQILIMSRLCEPLLIFYFLCELITFAIWGRTSGSALFFLASALLVLTLVRVVGFARISDTVDNMVERLVAEVRDGSK